MWIVHTSNLLTSFELPARGEIRTERDSSTNCCSAWRLGVNRELSVNQLKSFPHACEAKPVPTHCLFGIKSSTCVLHSQLDLIQCAFERHLELPHTAMLHGILEGFLQNPEEAECDRNPLCGSELQRGPVQVLRQASWQCRNRHGARGIHKGERYWALPSWPFRLERLYRQL